MPYSIEPDRANRLKALVRITNRFTREDPSYKFTLWSEALGQVNFHTNASTRPAIVSALLNSHLTDALIFEFNSAYPGLGKVTLFSQETPSPQDMEIKARLMVLARELNPAGEHDPASAYILWYETSTNPYAFVTYAPDLDTLRARILADCPAQAHIFRFTGEDLGPLWTYTVGVG